MLPTNGSLALERKSSCFQVIVTYSLQKELTLSDEELGLLASRACFICDETFTESVKVYEHLRIDHGVFNCILCFNLYTSQIDLEIHLRDTHLVFVCTSCPFLGLLENYLTHKENCSPDNSRILFYKTSVLMVREKSVGPKLTCPLCLESESGVQPTHSMKYHGLSLTELFDLKLITIPPNSLKSIVKSPDLMSLKGKFSETRLTLCGFCKLPCDDFSRLGLHLKERHNHFPCNSCQYTGANQLTLNGHILACHDGSAVELRKSVDVKPRDSLKSTKPSFGSSDVEINEPKVDVMMGTNAAKSESTLSKGPVKTTRALVGKKNIAMTERRESRKLTQRPEKCSTDTPRESAPHNKPLTSQKGFIMCHACPFSGKNAQSFIDHYRTLHEIKLINPASTDQLNCSLCTYSTTFVSRFYQHMQAKHSVYACGLCHSSVDSAEDLVYHIRTTCNPYIHCRFKACDICFTLKDSEQYLKHLRVDHLDDFFFSSPKCSRCDFTVDEKTGRLDFNDHLKNVHGLYSCDLCHLDFSSINSLIEHIDRFIL